MQTFVLMVSLAEDSAPLASVPFLDTVSAAFLTAPFSSPVGVGYNTQRAKGSGKFFSVQPSLRPCDASDVHIQQGLDYGRNSSMAPRSGSSVTSAK